MKYIGLQAQKSSNNLKSTVLLVLFPILLLGLIYLFFFILFNGYAGDEYLESTNSIFLESAPMVILVVAAWFAIAYFSNTYIIKQATHSQTLSRKDNKRVYNLVENLCMANGMKMPKVNIIYDDSLNAFASGINEKTYTVTLTKGIIDKLDDDELEGVIAHELSHIRNRDVRLLIVSIVFVGIFAFIAQIALRSLQFSSIGRSSKDKGGGIAVLVLVLVLAGIGYLFSMLFKFAISRKREYLADAGAAEMTRKPLSLANALRKVSQDSQIEAITREDVAQLFIEHPGDESKKRSSGLSSIFATHPPIEKRIAILEQF